MKKLYLFFISVILLSSCSDISNPGIDQNQATQSDNLDVQQSQSSSALKANSDVWVGAYLASYNHYVEPSGNWGNLNTDEIDWSAFTHLYYFALQAKADGSLSPIEEYRNMSPDRIKEIVGAAHDAEKPVLFTIGGWGNYEGFSNAIKAGNRSAFISNIVSTLKKWNFDGVDIDMEPIKSGDINNYKTFVNQLYSALQNVDVAMLSKPVISVATNHHPQMFAQIHDKIDQINLMTYDLSGAWEGWVSWHNASVFNGGVNFPGNGKPMPSADRSVKAFTDAGIPASKLGIGIDFYGYVWSGGSGTSTGGVTRPNQNWDTAPTVTDNVPYHKIMNEYYQSDRYHWDDKAKAAYLSIDQPGNQNDKFISYDDERSIRAKFDYIRQQGLGGAIIWELGGGYRKNQTANKQDELLQAVKKSMNNNSDSHYDYEGDGENDNNHENNGENQGDSNDSEKATTLYEESLNSNWINASWNSNVDFTSFEKSKDGKRSIKIYQKKWGALSVRSGKWNNARDIKPGEYKAIEFDIYSQKKAKISLMLENTSDQKFPKVSHGRVPANQWVTVRIPMSKLNPRQQIVHRIDISETSGSNIIYFVDNLKLIK